MSKDEQASADSAALGIHANGGSKNSHQNQIQKDTFASNRRAFHFLDKGYIIVTGAAGMLGSSFARRAVWEGGNVALVDIPVDSVQKKLGQLKDELESIREEIVSKNRQFEEWSKKNDHQFLPILQIAADVTKQDDIDEQILGEVQKQGFPIFGLFNNAGIQGEIAPMFDMDVDDFQKVIDVNVTGAFRVIKSVTKLMKEKGWKGSVVNTSSTANVGVPNMIGYSMSKAAITAMTSSASKDLAPFGIRVNAISPGHLGGFMWDRKLEAQAKLNTQYWPHGDPEAVGKAMLGKVPMRRYGDADEVSNVVCFLLSDESSFVTGQNMRISGGE